MVAKSKPHPALMAIIREGDAAVAEVLARAGQRLRAVIPKRRLPAWGTPAAESLRVQVRAIVGQMYAELADVLAAQAEGALAAGLWASNEEAAEWLTQRQFMAEFEPETLEVLRLLAERAERQLAGLGGALGVGD